MITACKCISPTSLQQDLQVHLPTCSIMAPKSISKLARSQPPRASLNLPNHGLQVHLQTCTITASKCNSNLARSQFPSVSPYSLDCSPQTCSITTLECISKFPRSWGGEMVELESGRPIMNTPPHLAWFPEGIREKERFKLQSLQKSIR
jgi:hypothetical protein